MIIEGKDKFQGQMSREHHHQKSSKNIERITMPEEEEDVGADGGKGTFHSVQ